MKISTIIENSLSELSQTQWIEIQRYARHQLHDTRVYQIRLPLPNGIHREIEILFKGSLEISLKGSSTQSCLHTNNINISILKDKGVDWIEPAPIFLIIKCYIKPSQQLNKPAILAEYFRELIKEYIAQILTDWSIANESVIPSKKMDNYRAKYGDDLVIWEHKQQNESEILLKGIAFTKNIDSPDIISLQHDDQKRTYIIGKSNILSDFLKIVSEELKIESSLSDESSIRPN